jgi:hypothetical protein
MVQVSPGKTELSFMELSFIQPQPMEPATGTQWGEARICDETTGMARDEKQIREAQTVATGTASHHRDVLPRKGRDAQFHGNLRSRNS